VNHNKALFDDEMKALFADLGELPKIGAQRKVNELIKRAKLCRFLSLST
jgi:hypothetical protein